MKTKEQKNIKENASQEVSPKLRLVVALLCGFFGVFGVHRFYVGKTGTGIAIILTFGGFWGIWPLVDFIMILAGKFTDKEGRPILRWTEDQPLTN